MFQYKNILIATTFHEPLFRLESLIESCLPLIKEKGLRIIVSCTNSTHEDVITYLKENGFTVSIPLKDKRVSIYLHALKTAINEFEESVNQRILYVDFDRLLHWIHNYPKEFLETLKSCIEYDLLHIGRNPHAFATHPETQQSTERIVNQLGSEILGFSEPRDLISVCYSFSKDLCETLLNTSYPTEMGYYASWPAILWRNANTKHYIEVDGQEWETPDRFTKEIKDQGYHIWLNRFQTAKEWKIRVSLLEDCIKELSTFI